MLDIIRSNSNIKQFYLYNITFIGLGMIIAGLGPVIPYLAVKFDRSETDFNLVFFWRMIGYLSGSVFNKYMIKFTTFHFALNMLSIGSAVPIIFFLFATSLGQCAACIFFVSFCGSAMEIVLQLAIIEAHRNNNEDMWLQIAYGSMGIGALTIPLLIEHYEQQGFLAFSVIMIATVPFYMKLKSPELITSQKIERTPSQIDQQKSISKMQFIDSINLGFVLFIYFGEEIGFSGWLSSYTVLLGVQDKQQAAFLNSIFWISMTLCRFLLSSILKGPPNYKFYTLIKIECISLLIGIVLQRLGFIELGAYFASAMMGLALSGMHPLILALPLYYRKQFSTEVSSNVFFLGILGEGSITIFVGMAMMLLGAQMFYICILLFMIFKIGILVRLVNKWENEKQSKENTITQLLTFNQNKETRV